jgi:hypothetical protein
VADVVSLAGKDSRHPRDPPLDKGDTGGYDNRGYLFVTPLAPLILRGGTVLCLQHEAEASHYITGIDPCFPLSLGQVLQG